MVNWLRRLFGRRAGDLGPAEAPHEYRGGPVRAGDRFRVADPDHARATVARIATEAGVTVEASAEWGDDPEWGDGGGVITIDRVAG